MEIDPALVERMVDLVRRIDAIGLAGPIPEEARAIVAELPAPVDPDLMLARETVAKWRIGYGEAIRRGEAWTEMVDAVLMGIKAVRQESTR